MTRERVYYCELLERSGMAVHIITDKRQGYWRTSARTRYLGDGVHVQNRWLVLRACDCRGSRAEIISMLRCTQQSTRACVIASLASVRVCYRYPIMFGQL